MEIRILKSGLVEHEVMAEAMRDLQKKRIAGEIGDTLIFVEQPEVVTIGPKAVRDGFDVKGYPT